MKDRPTHLIGVKCPEIAWGITITGLLLLVPLDVFTNDASKVTCPTCKAEVK